MLEEAIAHYHALLDAETARATQAQLDEQQRARNLFFGERPLVTVLRPRMISAAQYELLQRACGLVASAARRLAATMLDEPDLRAGLALTPGEEALIAMHPGYDEPSAHSRMDTFLTLDGASLQFVEYNAESPAAIAYEDELSELFLELPAMRRFAERYRISALPARQHLLETLLGAWRAFGGTASPSIAIVDWKGLPTHSEFLLFQRYFHEHGLEAVICSPDELRYQDGRLYAEADGVRAPVDLIYKRVLTSEFLMRYGDAALDHPLTQAYRAGKLCLVNSFRAKLLHKKSIFALLTDDALQERFSAEERAAIARHVPWTRMVSAGRSTYQGEPIDLPEFARANQERLLLKPNDEYGGKGIVIGWEVSPDTWARAIKEALDTPFVVQERVTIAYEDYPAMVDGQLQIGRRLVDSDPFLFGTNVAGCLTRLATETLLNVTAGGGSTIPTFVIDQR
jgi:Circularly permuted ATP-grasp type 2